MIKSMFFRLATFSAFLLIFGAVACTSGGSTDGAQESAEPQEEVQPEPETKAAETTGLVNPNRATNEELMAVPGMTETLVEAILTNRPFLNMASLNAVVSQGMDAAGLEALYGKLFVPINLNTASEEEIKMIPGVGGKMAHEFEEYRPYEKIAQFRREIGKYVDEAEVARLEQYVFVPIDLNTATEEEILAIPGVGKKMAHEFEEYRPYSSMEQFRREIGKYVDEKEVARLERYVVIKE